MSSPNRFLTWLQYASERPDRVGFRRAWGRVTPADIWEALLSGLLPSSETASEENALPDASWSLERIWSVVSKEEHRSLFPAIFRDPAPSAETTEPVEGLRLYQDLCGMVAGACAVQAAQTGDAPALERWIALSASAWAGIEPDRVDFSLPEREETAFDWLEVAYHAWQEACQETWGPTPLGAARSWGLSLCSSLAAPAHPSQSPTAYRRWRQNRIHLLNYQGDDRGGLDWLHLEIMGNGNGDIYPHPRRMGTIPMSGIFRETAALAWKVAMAYGEERRVKQIDVRWWITPDNYTPSAPLRLLGDSHGAAMTVGLIQLLRGENIAPEFAVTGRILLSGSVEAVGGVREKAKAALALRDGERYLIPRLFVPGPNELEARRGASEANRADSAECVTVAEHIDLLLPEAGGYLEQLRHFCQGEIDTILHRAAETFQHPEFTTLEREAAWKLLTTRCVPLALERRQTGVQAFRRSGVQEDAPMPHAQHPIQNPKSKIQNPEHLSQVTWEEYRAKLQRAVVLGEAGYGKTLLLEREVGLRCWEALQTLQEGGRYFHDYRFAAFLPARELALRLARIPEVLTGEVILNALVEALRIRRGLGQEIHGPFAERIRSGHCLVALDALDEAPDDLMDALPVYLRELPQARLVLSARPAGYRSQRLNLGLENELTLLPLTEPQGRQVVKAWFAADPVGGQELAQRIEGASRPMRLALNTPLLLRLTCQIAETARRQQRPLPHLSRRVDLYARFLENGQEKWASRSPRPNAYQQADFLPFAAEITLRLMEQRQRSNAWTGGEVEQTAQFSERGHPTLRGRPYLQDLTAAGILTREWAGEGQENRYTFTHQTFGEYLAGVGLANRATYGGWSAIRADLEKRVTAPEWEEVIVFLAAHLTRPDVIVPLLNLLCDTTGDPLRYRLALAARCLFEMQR